MKRLDDRIPSGTKTVAVMGHARPDGDCLGSVTGVYHYLTENHPELKVTVFVKDVEPYIAFLLSGVPYEETDGAGEPFDLAISVDASDPGRIGAGAAAFHSAKYRLVVDHHETNPHFGDDNAVLPDASSTAEVLTGLMDPEKISLRTAEALYTGIIHDSGVFRFSCTSADTLRAAALLMEKGVDCTGIIERSVSDQDYQELRIAAQCILDSVFHPEEGFLYAVCPTEMQERFGVTSHQLGHVVVELDQTAGADVTLFLYQFEDGSWKGSLRAKCDLNVAKIAARFGGGGHVRAAGFSYQGRPEKAVEKVREALKAQRSAQ